MAMSTATVMPGAGMGAPELPPIENARVPGDIRAHGAVRAGAGVEVHGDADTDAGSADLLALLQFSDSFFPGGASAFSWGLESMHVDGLAAGGEQVFGMLCALLETRWAGYDRPLMRAAHLAASSPDGGAETSFSALIALDGLCEATTLTAGMRAASRRLGFTQLRVHAGLGLEAAAGYLDQVCAECAPGHLPIAQGLIWQALGVKPCRAEAVSAYALCAGVAGAAIRLGRIGHLDGQRLLLRLRPRIDAVLAAEPPGLDELWTGAPALEIAAMRHEPRAARLFAT